MNNGIRIRALVIAAACVSAAIATGQPARPAEGARPQPPAREGADPARRTRDAAERIPQDAASMRRMIERRLEQLTRDTQRFEQALRRLESGESPEAIAKDLGPMRQGPEGDGPERADGPPGRADGPPGRADGPPGRSDGPQGRQEGRPDAGGRAGQGGTAAEREEIVAIIKEHAPLLAERLDGGRNGEPGTGMRMLGRLMPRVRDAMSYRRTDPEMFKLKMADIQSGGQVLDAVQAYRRAQHETGTGSAAAIEKAESNLREALRKQFDTRLAVQMREAEHLAQRLEAMRAGMDKRREMRDKEVNDVLTRVKDGAEFREPGPEAPQR